jgi:ABC-2 type transport system permease protein
MEKVLLKCIFFFNGFLARQGVDIDRMISIVQLKMLMDKRRVQMVWRTGQQREENTNHLRKVLLSYLLFGLFAGLLLLAIPSFLIGMIVVHSYILFMMSMTLITDFSTVLLDTADNQIILSRPVDGRTLFAARMIHILIYILQFRLPWQSFLWVSFFSDSGY